MEEIKKKQTKLRLEPAVKEFARKLNTVFKEMGKFAGSGDEQTILKAAIYAVLAGGR